MRITVLGGAGRMGCISIQKLAGDSRVDEVILADINAENAETVTSIVKSPKVTFRQVDVKDDEQLMGALKGADACLNA
jgi:saccharopine dehydrogenase-like NADP-dependent oxidoreductase